MDSRLILVSDGFAVGALVIGIPALLAVSLVALLYAGLLHVTALGLALHQGWARWVALLLLLPVLVVALGGALSLGKGFVRITALAAACAAGWACWLLVKVF